MRKIMISIFMIVLLSLVACTQQNIIAEPQIIEDEEIINEPLVGGDRDEHGCIGSAGYTWCETKQKCLRVWEEDCLGLEYPLGESDSELETGEEKVTKILTPEECTGQEGRLVNIVGGNTCLEDEIEIGEVKGFISPNICCKKK